MYTCMLLMRPFFRKTIPLIPKYIEKLLFFKVHYISMPKKYEYFYFVYLTRRWYVDQYLLVFEKKYIKMSLIPSNLVNTTKK